MATTETQASSPNTIALLQSPLPSDVTYAGASAPQKMAHDMAHIHNLFIRGFNSIVFQAPYVQPGTPAATDILIFTKLMLSMLHHHHAAEEDFVFPKIEECIGEEGFMAVNIAQHHSFEAALEKLSNYVEHTDGSIYSSKKFLSLLGELITPLTEHFSAELQTLLDLKGRASDEALLRIWGAAEEHAMKKGFDQYINMPLLMGLHDITYPRGREGSIQFPWFLPYLTYLVYERRYAGAWRFLPSTSWSKPRPLTFLPKSLGGLGVTD